MADLTGENDSRPPEKGHRRRGRPPGSTSKKKRQLFSSALGTQEEHRHTEPAELQPSGQISHKFTTRYQEAVKLYEKTGLTQRTLQILRRIACGRTFAFETQRGPVLQQLIDASKVLFLSELELVVWDIYLTNTQWNTLPMPFQTLLVVSGYFVKSIMSAGDTSYIMLCLSKQIPQFQACFGVWMSCCGSRYTVNPKELNMRYQTLLCPQREDDVSLINYNYYVDEIINLGCTGVEEVVTFPRQQIEGFTPPPMPEPYTPLPPLTPAKPTPRHLPVLDTSYREDLILPSPMLPLDPEFGPLTPMMIPYHFTYYSPPQSALPMLEDLESACLRPQTEL